jgi:hypothetical protein
MGSSSSGDAVSDAKVDAKGRALSTLTLLKVRHANDSHGTINYPYPTTIPPPPSPPPPPQNIFSPSMKCGGWSQFDSKFADPSVLSVFMDAAAAAAANSRAALTHSPDVDVIKNACSGLAGDRGFALTFSEFDERHKVRLFKP